MNTEKLRTWFSNSSRMVALSAALAQKQATLTKINSVSLPRAYHAIGKRVVSTKNLPTDLVPFRDKITQLKASMIAQPEQPRAEEVGGFANKAKQLAAKASKAAGDTAAVVQLQAAYVALGKQAVEKYGEKAIPKEVVEEYRSLITQRDTLKVEVESLGFAPGQGFVTPKRLAIAGTLVCLLVAVTVVRSTASWFFAGRSGLTNDTSEQVAIATSGVSRGLSTIGDKLARDQKPVDTDPHLREYRERDGTPQKRPHEIRDQEGTAQKGPETMASSVQKGGDSKANDSEPVVEISNLREKRPLLLVDNGSLVNLPIYEYRDRLFLPSRELPKGVAFLTTVDKAVPKSLKDAIAGYKSALAALQKRPVLASLQINEPLGKGRFLVNWQGTMCVLESTSTAFDPGKRHYIPVTCKSTVSYMRGGKTYEDNPYLVQVGEETSDEVGHSKKYTEDMQKELDTFLRAGQWVVYFGVVDLSADASRISEADVAKTVLLEETLPWAKELLAAVHKVATDTMTRDAPALGYALRCASRGMIADAVRRKHATNTQIDSHSEYMILPAASAIHWTVWFRSPGAKEEQVAALECLTTCGANWDEQDEKGRTPLMHAILAKQQHAVAYLCDRGLSVAKQDSEGRTPLMVALADWDRMFEPLLALPNVVKGIDRNGENALHYCNRYKNIPVLPTMKTLAEKGVSITAANKNGDTPLHALARAATRELSREFDDAGPWTEAVRFLVAKGGSGAAVNTKGETPIGILTQAQRHALTVGFMFPTTVRADAKDQRGKHRSIVLNDKSVLWVEDRGDHRVSLIKRSVSGEIVARRTIDGDLLQAGWARKFNVCGNTRGEVFCVVKRGKAVHLVASTALLEPKWESKAFYEIDNLAIQPDGGVVVLASEKFEESLVPMKIDARGNEVWGGRKTDVLGDGGKVIGSTGSSWVAAPNGIFAFRFSTIGSPRTIVSFSGEGVEQVRSQPFPKGSDVEITGVLSDGAILVQSPKNVNEAMLIGKGGVVQWRHLLGRCTGLCELRTGGMAVVSRSGSESRVSRIDRSGKISWEVGLNGAWAGLVQEGADGRVFVSSGSGDLLWTLSAAGQVLAVAQFPVSYGPPQPPRVFEDGGTVWPDETGTFMFGDHKAWPK
jgi:hypothetical protein